MDLGSLGRILLVAGLAIAVLGLVLVLAGRVPFLGRLPGDVTVRGDGWTVYAPLATSLVLSLLLTAVLSLVAWFGRR
jgi:hypothetical protein